MKQKPFVWDNDRGVLNDDRQVLQLVTVSSQTFRKFCGKLLVDALNKQEPKTNHRQAVIKDPSLPVTALYKKT